MATSRRAFFSLIAMVTPALLAACAANPPAAPAYPLAGTDWLLVQAGGNDIPKGSPDKKAASLQFEAPSTAHGYSAVNNFSGSYIARDGGLKFGPLIMTRRAGPPEDMAVESSFMAALEDTRGYRIAGDRLELLDTGGKLLARFEAARR